MFAERRQVKPMKPVQPSSSLKARLAAYSAMAGATLAFAPIVDASIISSCEGGIANLSTATSGDFCHGHHHMKLKVSQGDTSMCTNTNSPGSE